MPRKKKIEKQPEPKYVYATHFDTLIRISFRYKVRYDTVFELNPDLRTGFIRKGQKVRIE